MYCTRCGNRLHDTDRFCDRCGSPTHAEPKPEAAPPPPPPPPPPVSGLSRPIRQKSIGGVCAGFARYLGVDVALMRILWLTVAVLTGGLAVIVYIAAWMIMPADYSRSPAHPARA